MDTVSGVAILFMAKVVVLQQMLMDFCLFCFIVNVPKRFPDDVKLGTWVRCFSCSKCLCENFTTFSGN